MLDLFLYNWQVREEWFNLCKNISDEYLIKKRVGGLGSILHNLFHVIDCEQIWVNQMRGTPVIIKDINSISNLNEVIEFSNMTRTNTLSFLQSYSNETGKKTLEMNSKNGTAYSFSFDKIILHVITHEVHHIGQLSIWSREIGIKPISSDLLFKQL